MVTVTARGPAGHSSIPLVDNAIFRLGRALAKIGEYREPVTLTVTTRRFFSELSKMWPVENERLAMAALVSDDASESAAGARVLSGIPVLNAVLRNGISATTLSGGVAGNVIPAEVSAVLNVRTIPGHDIADVVRRLEECAAEPGVSITVAVLGAEAPESNPDSR
jgi:acetylornithine deacetylase/succinyl-diaminopimelate desuccinylase-like protein